MVFLEDVSYYRDYYYGVSNCGTCSKFNESKKYLDENISKKLHFHKGSSRPWVPKGPRGTMFLFKRHFFIIRGGRFVDTHLSTEKKPRAKKLFFHYVSLVLKSNLLEQSGEWWWWGMCQPIKVV